MHYFVFFYDKTGVISIINTREICIYDIYADKMELKNVNNYNLVVSLIDS